MDSFKIKLLLTILITSFLFILPNELVLSSKTTSSSNRFSLIPPKIISVNPAMVVLNKTTEIIIKGENFSPDSLVVVGESIIKNPIITANEIKFLLPEQILAGAFTISVQTPEGLAQNELQVITKKLEELKVGEITSLVSNLSSLGDGKSAKEANLKSVSKITSDREGNIFIADSINNRVRRIDALTNQITTIAGSGISGFSGDGGPALAARLNNPIDVAVDLEGNIFIADNGNLRVRRVDAKTNIISTYAGNGKFGCSSAFCGYFNETGLAVDGNIEPLALDVDPSGNLFIVDGGIRRNCIKKIDKTTQKLQGFMGVCERELESRCDPEDEDCFGIEDIAFDSKGNLFAVNLANKSIDKITPTKERTVFQRFGLFGNTGFFSRTFSISVDELDNPLFATSEDTIIKLDLNTGATLEIVAGNGKRGFSGDGGLAVDASLDITGESFFDDASIATDGKGNLYISDFGNDRIRKVSASSKIIETIAGGKESLDKALSSLLNVVDVEVYQNQLYLLDFYTNTLKAVDLKTGSIRVLAGTGQSGFNGDNILAPEASLNAPRAVAINRKTGDIFIADTNNLRVRKIDSKTGIITSVFNDQESFILDIALDSSGNLFILDDIVVRKVNLDTGETSLFAKDLNLRDPSSMGINSLGDIFIADNGMVKRIDAQTKTVVVVAGGGISGSEDILATEAALSIPRLGITFDKNDNLIIADFFGNKVRKVDFNSGRIKTIIGNGSRTYKGDDNSALAASLNLPFKVACEQDFLFVADQLTEAQNVTLLSPRFNRTVRAYRMGDVDDFGISIEEKKFFILISKKSSESFTLAINKLGNFRDSITLNLPKTAVGLSLRALETTDERIVFNLKANKKAACGKTKLIFQAQTNQGLKRDTELGIEVTGIDCIR